MIKTFKDSWLEGFFTEDKKHRSIPADIEKRLFRRLQMLDDAINENDLRTPPSNHLEKLSGNLEGCHSIRVNRQYRLIFKWTDEGASDVYLDNHSYRAR